MPTHRDAVDLMLAQWRRERPDLDSSGMAIVLRVLMLAGVFSERLKEILIPADLAPWEFDVLSALRREGRPGGLSPKRLCESAQLTSGAMTNRIDRLEDRGLVTRRANREDRRSISVALTDEGLALIDSVMGARMEDAEDCVAGLSKQDRRELAKLLRSVSAHLEP